MYCVIITSGILGIVLARWQGDRCWRELNRKLDKNEVPTDTILHGLLIFLAGICLILPGMFSDLIGVLLLLPPVRNKVIFYGLDKFRKYREELHRKERNTPKKQDDDVIDID